MHCLICYEYIIKWDIVFWQIIKIGFCLMCLMIFCWFQDSVGNNKRTQNRSELGATALYNDKASISSVTESQTASQIESETSDMVLLSFPTTCCDNFFLLYNILYLKKIHYSNCPQQFQSCMY